MNNLVLIEKKQMQEAFKPLGLDVFIAKIKQEVSKFTPDVTTVKGRAEIKTISYEISRSKTYLDGVGKEYVAHLKKLPVEADRERKRMRDTLDILKDETRAPLTEWERDKAAEKAVVTLALAINQAHGAAIQEDCLFNERRKIAKREAEIAEKEAALKAKQQAEILEKEKKEREVRIALDAANHAKQEAEERAKRIERERQEDADRAEREKQEAVKLAKETARQEADKIESDRLEAENTQREEEEKRIADKNHRERIFKQSVESLMTTFVCDDITQATQIVQAVADNLVKNISINY